ncbi:MAG: hypothetical protein AMJ94_00065 [Deltaproteobacteria bacterium SM23_61]|nr:MAG: hypothetical protein AMJ94_00065 [Deltaproteobacteria bacterium SM23_61]
MLNSRMQGGRRPLFHPSRKVKTGKGLSRSDLCALRLLSTHSPVLIPGGWKRKEESIFIKGFVFFISTKKKLCDLCVLCGLFFLPFRRAQRLS